MGEDAGHALRCGDHEVDALLVARAVHLVDIVQELVDAAERIAVHLVPAARLLQVQRGDDLRVVDRIARDRATPRPDEDGDEDEQDDQTPANTSHFAWNLPRTGGGNSQQNARGAARRPPLSTIRGFARSSVLPDL